MQTKRIFLPPVLPLMSAAAFLLAALPGLSANYQSTVLGDSPKAYYRLNDDTSRTLINKNLGSLGAAGNATNDLASFGGVVHSMPGAIVGDADRAVFFDFTTRTEIPFNSALNTPNTQPFTVEAWLYPVNDQDTTSFGGMGVLANRWTQGGNRQGWVVYQRRPNANYPTAEGLGWEFRMYDDLSTSTRLDVVSQAPFQLGKWQHFVVVYDPVQVSNATLTAYIDGVQANQVVWNGGANGVSPGYGPCTGDHSPAPNGQPAMALGGYNNANSGGNLGNANPWIGGIDEFAWYPAKLTAAQILAHYQNGTNANRSESYSSLILSHNPRAYLRLNEIAPGADYAINLGGVARDAGGGTGGLAGLGTHRPEARHPAAGAVASDKTSGATAYHNRNGSTTTTMPYNSENNGDVTSSGTGSAGTPFTFEAWLRPMRDQQGGQCTVNNRWQGGTGRTGWVIFQRNPNLTYPASEGHGWNFRMYSGVGTGGQDVLTDTDYVIGKWQHLVFTWEPQFDNGDVGSNGNDQWSGILTAYVDGVAVASNTAALYAANRLVTETAGPAADLGIGSYNAASSPPFGNPFEGDIGDLAIYNNYVLKPDQILAHYQAGTNSSYGTNYSTLVMTAAAEGVNPIIERTTLPATYLRLNDPAYYPAANSGTLGSVADGNLVFTTNTAAGPQAPAYAGFESTNTALLLDNVTTATNKEWASANNPAGLEISGQITLEAWIMPGAVQGDPARIISHGPRTLSDLLGVSPDSAVTNSSEVFLKIDGTGPYNYTVGSATFTNGVGISYSFATAAAPGADFGGGSWVHLAGTYDGANWRLYRNGVQIAVSAAAVGALPVLNGDWALGSTGNGWTNNYTGGLDEAAIYDTALSARKVATHYLMGKAGTTAVTITRSGSNVIISWPNGATLQQATVVTGPYTDVPGNPANPLTVQAGGIKYYRWRL